MRKNDIYAIELQLKNISTNLANMEHYVPIVEDGDYSKLNEDNKQHTKDILNIRNNVFAALKYIREDSLLYKK